MMSTANIPLNPTLGYFVKDFSEVWSQITGPVTNWVTGVRNGPDDREMSCLENFGRKVFGELCYIALFVASIVEAIVRAVLAIPAMAIAYLLPQSYVETKTYLLAYTFVGAVMSGFNAVISAAAIGQNILHPERMSYDEIAPCVDQYFQAFSNVVLEETQKRIMPGCCPA
jgi:hypothetical protein